MPKIRSMTGMGVARGTIGSRAYSIEVRSLNNRFLDTSVRLPYNWASLESKIKQLVGTYAKRGKVTIAITGNGKGEGDESILNEKRLKAYFGELNQVAKKLKAKPVELKDLVRLPQVFSAGRLLGFGVLAIRKKTNK